MQLLLGIPQNEPQSVKKSLVTCAGNEDPDQPATHDPDLGSLLIEYIAPGKAFFQIKRSSILAHWDYVPAELMLSVSRWYRCLSASALALESALAQCLSFQRCA